FFAIDAALSWLVQDYTVREELIKIGRRIGMCMFRERVSWSQIESKQDHFNWDASQYETLRKTYQKYEMPILELFHNAPD
ncbi:MAG: hypothetical protein IKW74_03805, partial [Thermoguttaceae bacterium]|nr:hypothetical protein [Thermoguttaceae bacterium]